MTTDTILILSGLGIFLFAMFKEQIKFKDIEIPLLNGINLIIVRILGLLILLIGIGSYLKIFPLKTNKINRTMIEQELKKRNINTISDFPITNEILEAIENGEKEYQTLICFDEKGQKITVPKDFKHCPYKNMMSPIKGRKIYLDFKE